MGVTFTIDQKSVEGNRRVNYGHFDMVSGDCSGAPSIVRSLNTGLRMVERLTAHSKITPDLQSGVALPTVTYPGPNTSGVTTWPALNSISGHFTIEFTSTTTIYWEAKGKM